MRVAIIGSAGFVGGYLSGHFRGAGAEVIAVERLTPLPEEELDVVIDCNGDARRFWVNENPIDGFKVSVQSVAERLARLKTAKYVYLSSIDVYGTRTGDREASQEKASLSLDGLDSYGFYKLLAERLVEFHAADALILRLGTLIGPGLRKNPVFDAVNGDLIRQTPDSTLSLMSLEVLAKVLDTLLETGADGVYNITAEASVSVADMLEMVSEALGKDADAFTFDSDLSHTDYDISVAKISRVATMPNSKTILKQYLSREI